jgi:hypothetical protein
MRRGDVKKRQFPSFVDAALKVRLVGLSQVVPTIKRRKLSLANLS